VQAWGTLYDVLLHSSSNEYKAPIILHSCNSIPLDFIHQFAKNIDNVYFSLNGRAIHSPKEISVINAIPLNRMLLETDSPSQIPMELKGMTLYNEPKLLNFSFNLIAKIRIASGVDAFPPSSTNVSGKYNLIRKKVYENSIRVFRALSRV
jgi:Tat protein secretion system quality control protein TatD with DNase activity